jgi:hypothetical protein
MKGLLADEASQPDNSACHSAGSSNGPRGKQHPNFLWHLSIRHLLKKRKQDTSEPHEPFHLPHWSVLAFVASVRMAGRCC